MRGVGIALTFPVRNCPTDTTGVGMVSDVARGRLAIIDNTDGKAVGQEGVGVLTARPEGLAWSIRRLLRKGEEGLVAWDSITDWEFGELHGAMGARPGSYGVVVSWDGGQAMLLNGGPEADRRYRILTLEATRFAPEVKFTFL
jgi:hypothetical protein